MKISNDLRNLRRITREITSWGREIEAAARPKPTAAAIEPPPKHPPKPAPAPKYPLPPGYSRVTCKDCDAPAILIHGPNSFAALCPSCRVITHLEAIDQEHPK